MVTKDRPGVIRPPDTSGEETMATRTLSAKDDGQMDDSSSARDLELEQVRKAVKGIRFGEVRL